MSAWRDLRGGAPRDLTDLKEVRQALLDFIADFANWDNSNDKDFLETSRALVQCAHESLGGAPGTRPLVVDPFAGGGTIPLEALRVGAEAFASDLNPVAILLNRIAVEYGSDVMAKIQDGFRTAAAEVEQWTREFLAPAYRTSGNTVPIAYLWARTIFCEGPACGAQIPLLRTLCLSKQGKQSAWLKLSIRKEKRSSQIDVDVVRQESPTGSGTVKNGSVVCPACDFTTKADAVRAQLARRHGGSSDARFVAMLERLPSGGKEFRAPNVTDQKALGQVAVLLGKLEHDRVKGVALIPDEPIPTERPSPNARGLSAVTRVGMLTFGDLYSPRQALVLCALAHATRMVTAKLRKESALYADVINVLLSAAVSKRADFGSSLCSWRLGASCVRGTFARQALANTWDFGEMYPFAGSAGDWGEACSFIEEFLAHLTSARLGQGTVANAGATSHPLPDDAGDALITDPPYYDSVPYSDLSDYFYVWLRRSLVGANALSGQATPKDGEIIWNPTRFVAGRPKDKLFYEEQMTLAFAEGRRVTKPQGIGVVVFAHKSTAGWEAVLEALIRAGWIATGSWPLDTERAGRTNAVGTASLGSSVHIVCRPRENSDGSLRTDEIGDWREVLAALPKRIHEWMPRLREEGIVGADAIFACLGPALEIFSRYSKVEKASGEVVALKEYLEHVWAAVAKEALTVIFSGADTAAFEEDARLTAMWLWTLNGGPAEGADAGGEDAETDDDDADSGGGSAKGGFELEYDAARKIAQGLGAHLEDLTTLVEISGSTARLLPVAERATSLFGQPETAATAPGAKKKRKQLTLGFVADGEADAKGSAGLDGKLQAKPGTTVLDRVQQAMILFGAGRGEALRRFLVDDGAGKDDRFWRLGQALAALYPTGTDERRFIEGVMARKKGLGL
jgi:adenine-specific DNA methylase